MKKLNQKNTLSATVSMLMTLTVCSSVSQASDIDIYSNATGGKTTITMMLDTSGSMGHGDGYWGDYHGEDTVNARNSPSSLVEDYNVCKWDYTRSWSWGGWIYTYSDNTKTDKKIDYKVGEGTTKSFYPTYCSVNQSTFNNLNSTYKSRIEKECEKTGGGFPYVCYDRISRLKMAMIKLLTGDQILNTTRIGIGQFSSPVNSNQFSHDGRSARILYPAVELTAANREKLLEKIVSLDVYNGTPSAMAYAESAAYLLGANTSGMTYSGYAYSDANTTPKIRNANNGYVSPLTGIDTSSQCNGQGVYFLTDGFANNSYTATQTIMEKVLGKSLSGTGLSGNSPSGNNQTQGWPEIGKFAKLLRNEKYIKTAVVGFGSLFPNDSTYVKTLTNTRNKPSTYYDCSKLPNPNASGISDQEKSNRQDLINTCNWGAKPQSDILAADRSQIPSSVGGYGNGGFYSAQSTDDVVQSVVKFLDDVKPEFEPIATGSPTLPQDALNPLRIQPYGYYGSFTPKPQESTQLWVGNMNKYHIFNGELYNASKTIRLIKADGSLDAAAKGLWTDEGMKGQLPLGLSTNAANEKIANRTIYTNREITGTAASYAASETNSLKKVNVTTLFGTGTSALFANDPDKNYWLNLLGYNVAATGTVTLADLITKPELRQVGSVMHSTPILLTQSGKISYTSGTIDTTDRDDYLLFGSTQGLLHVVRAGKNATDANRGKEIFAFAPNEMMQNQKAAFLSETSSTLGKNNLFYGIDAPWTAYTQYVAKADGTLTVKDSGRVAQNASGDDIAIKGLQWVYGGLRMGGKSYYALNLSDLDNPELKFHIDPANSKIYKSSSTTTGVTALSYMGQSWSKPTIAYVNFGGVKKLVMFVGGGYDAGYENAAYDQNTTTGGGAGVYMFDANNGDLLWWTSANATAAGGAEAYTNASATSINMKYSVVSQINAIDRDNDGLVDNLYFGDLGGQAFRVDLNNAATGTTASDKKANFAKRVVRLFDEHATGGASPRFYEMPSVSIHDSDDGYVAAVAFSSGNRSSPLVGTAAASGTNNQAGSTVSATDGVFVVYDKDVAKSDLYTLTDSVSSTQLTTKNISLTSLNTNISTGVAITGNNGWKYTYSSTAGVYKGMNELYALDGMLYVNVFHRDGTGIGGSCGAGVKGDSYVYQFCLPTGKCPFNTTTSGVPNSVKLGAGILGAGLGQGRSSANNTGLIVNRQTTLNCTTSPNLPECQEFTTTAKLRQLRWYETR